MGYGMNDQDSIPNRRRRRRKSLLAADSQSVSLGFDPLPGLMTRCLLL
jgi:hypothetical protein